MSGANAAANVLSQSAQAVQNATQAVDNAAANMGANSQTVPAGQGTPVAPNSAAAANLAAGLVSAQNSSNQAAGKPAAVPLQGNTSPAVQLLPNANTAGANLDTALRTTSNAWQQSASGQKGGTNLNSQSMARMLQSFSQSTVTPGTVGTSAGRGQIILPGQGGNLTAANPAGEATLAGKPVPGGTPTNPAAASTGPSPAANPGSSQNPVPASPASGGTNTAAGAATLRAEGAQGQATTSNPGKAGMATGNLGSPATPATPPEAAAARQANLQQAQQAALTQASTQSATAEKSGTAHSQQQVRAGAAGGDAPTVAGMAAPMSPQDPAPKAGQLGLTPGGVASDPAYMSQVAAASGFGARLQQALNVNLGIPGLTPGTLVSIVGGIILAIVILRVFFNGFPAEEVVGLSFATILGIMLLIAPWLMRDKPDNSGKPRKKHRLNQRPHGPPPTR